MMDIDTEHIVKLTPDQIIDKHISVIGMTGSGKTVTLYTLAYQIATSGTKVTIVDPEGEFSNLRFGLKTVVVGRGRKGNHIDIELTPDNAPAAADILCRYNIPLVVLDISGFNIETRDEFVLAYVGRMWELYQQEDLPPGRLIIDESQLFAPQRGAPVTKKLLLDMGGRARKRNLGLVFATQRPQRIDKDLLDASYIRLFHHVATGAALNAITDLLPGIIAKESVTPAVAQRIITNLDTGECLFMINQSANKVHICPSPYKTDDKNKFVGVQMPFADEVLEEVKRLIATNAAADEVKAEVKHQAEETSRVASLLAENEDLRLENDRLRAENEILRADQAQVASNLKAGTVEVEITSPSSPSVGGGEVTSPANPIEVRDAQRKAVADQAERERQCRNYKNFMLTVSKQSHMDRRILSYLVDHPGHAYTTDELEALLGYSDRVIGNTPPLALTKAKLVTRVKFGRRVQYRSDFLDWASSEFSTIPAGQIQADIAELANERK